MYMFYMLFMIIIYHYLTLIVGSILMSKGSSRPNIITDIMLLLGTFGSHKHTAPQMHTSGNLAKGYSFWLLPFLMRTKKTLESARQYNRQQ